MVLKKHLIYWFIPSIINLLLVFFYYFNIFDLSYIISPEYNREFGVLENLQLVIVLAIIYVSYISYKKNYSSLVRFLYVGIILFSILIFLEEIDYGMHIYDYLSGKTIDDLRVEALDANRIRNLHNQGDLTNIISLFVYISYVLIILVLPLVLWKTNYTNIYLEWIVPSRYLAYALIAMTINNRIALYLNRTIDHGKVSLWTNVSEFEEIFIYYIAFLYLYELSMKKFPSKTS